jgi:endonuclease YncB( thermonuclease family)
MPNGLLEVTGTLDLAQFWPAGESDGDTAKVVVGANAFKFTGPNGIAKITHAFDGATVKGAVSKPTIDKNNQVTIRWQGIDAPELHYRPIAPTLSGKKPTATQRAAFNKVNGNFRQYLGESAPEALAKFMATFGAGPLPVVVRTQVDEPNDVFDTYGRLIGDIILSPGHNEVNANHWMCENGWAYPTYYSSMTPTEINQLQALTATAKQAKKGIWQSKANTSDLSYFDPTMVFVSHGAFNAAKDKGKVFLPKLFRRRSTYAGCKAAKMTAANFKKYLSLEPDACFATADFLANGVTSATPRHLDEFVSTDTKFTVTAGDLVFQEGKSRVVGPDGKPVNW